MNLALTNLEGLNMMTEGVELQPLPDPTLTAAAIFSFSEISMHQYRPWHL